MIYIFLRLYKWHSLIILIFSNFFLYAYEYIDLKSKYPEERYKCTKNEDNLKPDIHIEELTPQGEMGVCYAASALFMLQEAINRENKGHGRIKLSLSDAICSMNNEKSYASGGVSQAALLNLAKKGSVLSCSSERIPHENVAKICKQTIHRDRCYIEKNDNLLNRQYEKFINNFVGNNTKKSVVTKGLIPFIRTENAQNDRCCFIDTNNFVIYNYEPKDEQEMLLEMRKIFDNNQGPIAVNLEGHTSMVFGINTYSCVDLISQKTTTKKTFNIIDPNGFKQEIIADSWIDDVVKNGSFYFLQREKHPVQIHDVFQGPSALIFATSTGDVDILNAYLSKNIKIDTNITNKQGNGPLSIASINGYSDMVGPLLENNADINHANNLGFTPLALASSEGHLDVIKILLKNDEINVNKSIYEGLTPLWIASSKGHDKIVKLLIENNADINKASHAGATPLLIAVTNGHVNVVRYLLEKGAKLGDINNKDRQKLLFMVSQKGHSEMANLLRDYFENIDTTN